jgi:hypothetical protein
MAGLALSTPAEFRGFLVSCGLSWSAPAWVGDTGPSNGNPPAIAVASNGVICVAYGDRTRRRICVRYSHDGTHCALNPDCLIDVAYFDTSRVVS